MKIKLKVIEPEIVNVLIDSNNQQETRIDMLSSEINKIKREMQSVKDENQRKKSMEF